MKANKITLFVIAGGISAFVGSWVGFYAHGLWEGTVGTGLWTCCIGLFLVASFIVVQDYYVGKVAKIDFDYLVSVLSAGKNKLVIGAVGGFMGGASLALLGGEIPGWFVEGLILGAALCKTVPNISLKWTCIGGGIAGAVGFIIVMIFSDVFPSSIAVALGDSLKGILFGSVICFSEKISRKAWVEIIYPGNESRTVTLGSDPILFGGADIKPKVGQLIYVPGTSIIEKKYTFDGGQVKCFCQSQNKELILTDGHRETVGRIEIVTHLK